tara:strand:- start:2697 stop:2918 length:222 start_codon:yes stop_codon:yes gene_type:complete
MCVFSVPKPPTPEPIAPAPRPEATARAPVVGRKRAVAKRTPGSRTSGGTKAARRFGTRSLRIPLSGGSGNLNY